MRRPLTPEERGHLAAWAVSASTLLADVEAALIREDDVTARGCALAAQSHIESILMALPARTERETRAWAKANMDRDFPSN